MCGLLAGRNVHLGSKTVCTLFLGHTDLGAKIMLLSHKEDSMPFYLSQLFGTVWLEYPYPCTEVFLSLEKKHSKLGTKMALLYYKEDPTATLPQFLELGSILKEQW